MSDDELLAAVMRRLLAQPSTYYSATDGPFDEWVAFVSIDGAADVTADELAAMDRAAEQ